MPGNAVHRLQCQTVIEGLGELIHDPLVNRVRLSAKAIPLNNLPDLHAILNGEDAPPDLGTRTTREALRTDLCGAAALTGNGVADLILLVLQNVELLIDAGLVRISPLMRRRPYGRQG